MQTILDFLTAHSTILGWILAALAAILAPKAVKLWHDFVARTYADTGLKLPESPEIDADIEAVVKAIAPALLSGRVHTAEEAVQVITTAVKAANPTEANPGPDVAMAVHGGVAAGTLLMAAPKAPDAGLPLSTPPGPVGGK